MAEFQRIGVGVASIRNDELGIGLMLLRSLSRQGHEAMLVEDGDAAACRCDLLLLTGSARPFVRYPRMLRAGRPEDRPRTALWLLEPLPPPSLTSQSETLGMRLARADSHRLSRPGRRLLQLLPFQSSVRRIAESRYAARFQKKLSGLDASDCTRVSPCELRNVMCECRWFRECYSKRWCDFVFASTRPRCQFLQSRGIAATFVPMGYEAAWGRDLGLQRDIDVLFLGRTDRTSRPGPLRTVREDLVSRGIELRIVTKGCYGDERTRLLNRARIVLDLPRLPWEMPLMRLLMCAGCGALVASNWTGDPAPFMREHLVQAETGRLAETLVHYLEGEDHRRRVVASAFEFVTTELTLERSLATILNTCAGIGQHADRRCADPIGEISSLRHEEI